MSGICDTCQRNQVCRRPMDGMDSCRLYVSGRESNYEKLFGTPERTALTLRLFSPFDCPGCVLESTCGGDKDVRCFLRDYSALLEWLMGDAE